MDVKLNILNNINSRLMATEGDGKTLIRILVAFGTIIYQVNILYEEFLSLRL